MLRELTELARKMDMPPTMYQPTTVAWYIELDKHGAFKRLVFLSGAKDKRGLRRLAPHLKRTVAITPKLLADNAEYVLGIARETSDSERVKSQHEAFKLLTRTCAERTGHPKVEAVVQFLERFHLPELLAVAPGLKPEDVLTFRVDDEILIDLPEVQAFWADYTGLSPEGTSSLQMCLVCGQRKPVLERLPLRLKGIPGGQPSGTDLVSANLEAFESYGLTASLNSPICQECAEAFGNALNGLLAGESTRLYVGPTVYAFWTRDRGDFQPAVLLAAPSDDLVATLRRNFEDRSRDDIRPGEVQAFLASPMKGQDSYVETNRFYAVALSGNSARAVVRDWFVTTLPEAQNNLLWWCDAQRIVAPDGGEPRLFPVRWLAENLYRDPTKEMDRRVVPALVRLALKGERLPRDLMSLAVRRVRVVQSDQRGGRLSHARAAMMKLLVLSQGGEEMNPKNQQALDPECSDSGYQCGRLLAVLDEIQHAAVPGIKATVSDRYYGAASSTPEHVFRVLQKLTRAHLTKLRKNRQWLYRRLDEALEEVLSHIRVDQGGTGFPRILGLTQQAMFFLGYYHQKAAFRQERLAYAQSKGGIVHAGLR